MSKLLPRAYPDGYRDVAKYTILSILQAGKNTAITSNGANPRIGTCVGPAYAHCSMCKFISPYVTDNILSC